MASLPATPRFCAQMRSSAALVALLCVLQCAAALRVVVTGAGGRTGKLVFQQLNENESVEPLGFVRSKKATKALKKIGATSEQIVTGDTMDAESLAASFDGCDAVVLCTSAVPAIKPWSIVKLLFKKKVLRREDAGRPEFKFGAHGTPQEVDWLGAKKQIDAAKAAGVGHFVFISSMGGTQPDNFLNLIGRQPDGTGGDILLWKRKAERYLISSGMDYTIIHPGGLVDTPSAERQLDVDVDDVLLERESRQVPRGDVARVACAAVAKGLGKGKSFDLVSLPVGEGVVTANAADVFGKLGGKTCKYEDAADPPSLPGLA